MEKTTANSKSSEIPTNKTRWKFLLWATLLVTAVFLSSFFGVSDGNVSFTEWTDFIKWAFGLYALSEVGAKGAHAAMNRKGL